MSQPSLLPASWKVPAAFRQRLGENAGRQRAMFADGHLLLILHSPARQGRKLIRDGNFFWRDPAGTWQSTNHGQGPEALQNHLHEFVTRQTELDRQLQQGDLLKAEDYFQVLQIATPLQRTTRNLHLVLQEARELVPEAREILVARDLAGGLERTAELTFIDAKHGLEFATAHQMELHAQNSYQVNIATHRLNRMIALFLPLATVSAVFGMNLPQQIVPESGGGFMNVVVLAIVAGVLLQAFISRPAMPLAETDSVKNGTRQNKYPGTKKPPVS